MRDTIDMAREAWISEPEAEMLRDSEECYLSCTYLVDLKAFEALVRADQQEIDAKVCETTAPSQINGYECADLIRNRRNK